MAKKSKTQRAKASAARAERKAQAKLAEEQGVEVKEAQASTEAPKKGLLKKSESAAPSTNTKAAKAVKAKEEKKEKKPGKIKTFIKGVKSELRRVTWPTRQDVLRWSGVVVAALVFFGVSVAVLDNFVVTPLLVAISSLSGFVA